MGQRGALEERVIAIPRAGAVRLERSARARRLSISVRPFTGARVAVPRGCSFADAERFAHSMGRWLERQHERLRRLEQARASLPALQSAPPDRATAARLILARLQSLAAAHAFTYRCVIFREQRTVWGSCSVRNDLRLNLKLARLEPVLIDYVLLHELVHTRVKHHGSAFWAELQRSLPQARALAARLRQFPLYLM